jgi:RHS repeat-associated protein
VDGVTTSYTWDVAAGLPVVLQDGTNTYVYGLDLISTTDNAGVQTYNLYDGLGSTTDLTDGSGNTVASYGYDVFGAIRAQSGSNPNYWLFTGEQRDAESDLYYLRTRYYDPSTGRFLTRDPLWGSVAVPESQNRYPYVGCNPVNRIDPTGLRWINDGDGGGASKEGASFENDQDDCRGGRLEPAAETLPRPGSPPGPGAGMVCMERNFISLSDLRSALQEASSQAGSALEQGWSATMTALSSECAQGFGRIAVAGVFTWAAFTGVGAVVEAGGIVIYSAGAAATSGAAAYYAAGPDNVSNVITYLPTGVQMVVTGCH